MDKENVITVALIDDNDLLRNAIRQFLESFGFRLLWEAVNGKETLEKIAGLEVPNVCIVDINMPVMDGFETVAALRQNYNGLKIIVFSVNDDYRDMEKMLQYGIDGYLLKGADPAELETAVKLVYCGRKYFSEAVRPMVVRYLSENRAGGKI